MLCIASKLLAIYLLIPIAISWLLRHQMLDEQCIASKLLDNIFVDSNCNIMAITSSNARRTVYS